MKLMFMGSIPGHIPNIGQTIYDDNGAIKSQYLPLFETASKLGYYAARSQHRIMIASQSKRTIDYHLAKGAVSYCEECVDQTTHIEMHFPEGKPRNYDFPLPENLHVLKHPHPTDESSPHRWIVAHARALDACDVLVVLGGGVSTRVIAKLAHSLGKPLIAIPCFGGSAKDIYPTVRTHYSRDLLTCVSCWDVNSPEKLMTLIPDFVKKHSEHSNHKYFISYSWKNCTVADHIEVLLRRENRMVIRDERDIKTGDDLNEKIQVLIEECDTFLSLWSKDAANSTWCKNELRYASKLKHRHSVNKPQRVILILLDDTPPPLTENTEKNIRNLATRREYELEVLKLLESE